jgi:nitroimidazol reductase NimA-like FMN-containing flavoprotein (pyridoxamine 5'-phosphate oxidase superfamily)
MTDDELESFLLRERTVRLGTVSADGAPHVAPLWYVWHEGTMYFNSLKHSRRGRDLSHGSRVAACVDAGDNYVELHGAVLYGTLTPLDDPELNARIRKLFGEKYWGGIDIPEVKSHTWFALKPDEIVSWDFKKIPAGRDRRLEATATPERSGGPQKGAER